MSRDSLSTKPNFKMDIITNKITDKKADVRAVSWPQNSGLTSEGRGDFRAAGWSQIGWLTSNQQDIACNFEVGLVCNLRPVQPCPKTTGVTRDSLLPNIQYTAQHVRSITSWLTLFAECFYMNMHSTHHTLQNHWKIMFYIFVCISCSNWPTAGYSYWIDYCLNKPGNAEDNVQVFE